MLFGNTGERSCGDRAPRYVRGAYWRGNFVRNIMKAAKKARAINNEGTKVERRDEADDVPPRVDPTF